MNKIGSSSAMALASGTIINAIATGKGSAFGIDLNVCATVELIDDGKKIIKGIIKDHPSVKPNLIETCVKNVLNHFELDYSATVVTKTTIPVKSGLSSSSATSNAVVMATIDAIGEKLDPKLILNLAIKPSFDEKLTITGAYDDATASYYGGITITDKSDTTYSPASTNSHTESGKWAWLDSKKDKVIIMAGPMYGYVKRLSNKEIIIEEINDYNSNNTNYYTSSFQTYSDVNDPYKSKEGNRKSIVNNTNTNSNYQVWVAK